MFVFTDRQNQIKSEVLLDQRVEMNAFPPLAILVLFTIITQLSCFDKCDQKELDIALQKKDADLLSTLEESCNIEEQQVQFLRSKTPTPELELLWENRCPKSISLSKLMSKGKLQRRKEVLDTCPQLLHSTPQEDFLWSTGEPIWALLIYPWLQQHNIDQQRAKRLSDLLLAPPLLLPSSLSDLPLRKSGTLQLPSNPQLIQIGDKLKVGDKTIEKTQTLLLSPSSGEGGFGEHDLYLLKKHLSTTKETLILAEKKTSVKLLSRVLATLKSQQATMLFCLLSLLLRV